MRHIAVLLSAGSLVGLAFAVDMVDFEDVTSHGNPIWTSLVSEGFLFTSQHFHTIDDPESSGAVPELPGSRVYIAHEGGSLGRIITMTPVAGGTFSVFEIAATKAWLNDNPVFPNATYVELVASLAGGGTRTVDLTLNVNPSWNTFTISPPLLDVTSMTIDGRQAGSQADFAFGVDNINLVPEPAALSLLVVALAAMRRR